jgi:tetratricopeptide (TPR) repeat protein
MTTPSTALRQRVATITLACLVAAACSAPAWAADGGFAEQVGRFVTLPTAAPQSEMLQRAVTAVGHIKAMELPQASSAINEALQLDARNSYLHFFNGFIYHLQARQGDAQKNDLAIEGYEQALRLDPGNWIAQEFLGLVHLDLKQYEPAKRQFAEVLLLNPDSSVALQGLMVAAYMTGDAVTACAMADQLRTEPRAQPPAFTRSSVAVYASCGQFDKAEAMRQALARLGGDRSDLETVDRRLGQWKTAFRQTQAAAAAQPVASSPSSSPSSAPGTDAALQTAQAATPPSPPPSPPPPPAPPAAPPPDNDGTPRMVLVDVVLVSTQELVTTAKGINLLNALSLQLGSSSAAAFSRTYNGTAPEAANIITRAITVPALAYSLNIANANNMLNEVLARPTLAAMEGLPSEFFSGTNLSAAVVQTSALGGSSAVPVEKRFGVKLAVTPAFLPNGMLRMKVEALRTFLNANTDSAGFAYRLEISETSANANVVMRLGDTLVLSGLSEKETSSSRTGVPGLQEVPLVQYLFASKRTSDFQRSVLILLTPRAPIYTARADAAAGSAAADSMRAVRERFGFSGRAPSNVESILNHLKTTTLFRDFRQGDVSLERWDRTRSTGDRLRQALDFLYF